MKCIKWLVPIILVIIIICSIKSEAEKRGFCFREFSHIDNLYTEQELIDRAIAFKIEDMPGAVFTIDRKHIKIIGYASVEDLKQKNPNCCVLTKAMPDGNPSGVYGVVKIDYWEYYENNIRLPKFYEDYILYDSCGKLGTFNSFTKF